MALTFELSKVETPAIRERMVAHLLNIDEGLAQTVADKLGMKELPKAADAAVKSAKVRLVEIRLAMALGGKAFVTLTGSVAAVRAAVEAGAAVVAAKGLLTNKVVIPNPRAELLTEML